MKNKKKAAGAGHSPDSLKYLMKELRQLGDAHYENVKRAPASVREAYEECVASSNSSGAGDGGLEGENEDAILQLSESIWLRTNARKITKFTALMRGVDDPYEGGFYCFDISIPPEYPFKPPEFKFLTCLQTSININPNLYGDCGKVCLSILGTFPGPSWTSAMSLESVCRQIQALLVPNPLENEPGYGPKEDKMDKMTGMDMESSLGMPIAPATPGKGKGEDMYDKYKQAVRHANLRIAVVRMLTRPPTQTCRQFLPLMRALFARDASKMIAFARMHASKNPESRDISISAGPANFTERVEYAKRADELEKLVKELGVDVDAPGASESGGPEGAEGGAEASDDEDSEPAYEEDDDFDYDSDFDAEVDLTGDD